MITKEIAGVFIVMALTAGAVELICSGFRIIRRGIARRGAERAAERRWDHLRD